MADVHDPPARESRWRADRWRVAAATFGGGFAATALDLQDSLTRCLACFETWQVDETPLSLLVLAATANRIREGCEWIETMGC